MIDFWVNDGQGIDKAISEIKNKYEVLERENKLLREANSELKSEHYKDEELQKIKQENDELRKELVRGFPITEKEQLAINNWLVSHDCTKVKRGIDSYNFGIIPGIGYNGSVKCYCGKEFCFCTE